jgi:hypothetical protein
VEVPWRERSRLVRRWRLLRTRRPATFTEKVRYKMLRDRRPLLVTLADKAAVRDYAASVVGKEYLPESYGILTDPADLWALDLPPSFVVKPTHGSGAVVAVHPAAPTERRLPPPEHHWVCTEVHPAALERGAFEALAAAWLRRVHGSGPNREWAYSFVPPRLLVEEFLVGADGGIPHDYKFFVFHGRCQYVQVDTGRFGRHTQDFFLPSWDHLPMSGGLPWADPVPPRPAHLQEMIALAERLGRETDFVRVDLYSVPGRIVFGEMTSYPAGGNSPFFPASFNAEFGRHWTVPARYVG